MIAPDSDAFSLDEWAKNVVGRDWEIFWGEETNDDGDDNQNDKAEGDIEDWYEGHINELVETTFQDDNENNDKEQSEKTKAAGSSTIIGSSCTFEVSFVGDDEVYTMELNPSLVRPSARAWVKRTRAILAYHTGSSSSSSSSSTNSRSDKRSGSTNDNFFSSSPSSSSASAWEDSLPHDTSTLKDRNSLQQIQTEEDEEWLALCPSGLPLLLSSTGTEQKDEHNDSLTPACDKQQQPTQQLPGQQHRQTRIRQIRRQARQGRQARQVQKRQEQLQQQQQQQRKQKQQQEKLEPPLDLMYIRKLRRFVRSQLHLRSRLSSLDNDDHEPQQEEDEDEAVPTEAYVNYLIDCLQDLSKACDWFVQSWEFHYRNSSSSNSGGSSIIGNQNKSVSGGNANSCGVGVGVGDGQSNDDVPMSSSMTSATTYNNCNNKNDKYEDKHDSSDNDDNNNNNNSSNGENNKNKKNEEHVIRNFLLSGRRILIPLLINVDTTPTGAKAAAEAAAKKKKQQQSKKRPLSSPQTQEQQQQQQQKQQSSSITGTRKTKRRRTQTGKDDFYYYGKDNPSSSYKSSSYKSSSMTTTPAGSTSIVEQLFGQEEEEEGYCFNNNNDEGRDEYSSLLSKISDFVEKVYNFDQRWFIRTIASILTSFSNEIIKPYLQWKHQALIMLGERSEDDGIITTTEGGSYCSDVVDTNVSNGTRQQQKQKRQRTRRGAASVTIASDGETSKEDSGEEEEDDDDDEEEDGRGVPTVDEAGRTRCYSFEEIQSYLNAIDNDPVLQLFDLSMFESKIRKKLYEIEAFENRALHFFSQLMIDNNNNGTTNSTTAEDSEGIDLVTSTSASAATTAEGSSSNLLSQLQQQQKQQKQQQASDLVIAGLDDMKSIANTKTSCLFNVNPLGRRRCRPVSSLKSALEDAAVVSTTTDSTPSISFPFSAATAATAATTSSSSTCISFLNRDVLDMAIRVRSWFNDLRHAETCRERLIFVERIRAKACNELPRLLSPLLVLLSSCSDGDNNTSNNSRINSELEITISSKLDACISRVTELLPTENHNAMIEEYERQLLNNNGNSNNNNTNSVVENIETDTNNTTVIDFHTIRGIETALHEMRSIPVVSAAEEMLVVRLDLLSWKERAEQILFMRNDKDSNTGVMGRVASFEELEEAKESLDSILDGWSTSRCKLLLDSKNTTDKNTVTNIYNNNNDNNNNNNDRTSSNNGIAVQNSEEINAEIRAFALGDVNALCMGPIVTRIQTIFSQSSAWKEKAVSIFKSLQLHGYLFLDDDDDDDAHSNSCSNSTGSIAGNKRGGNNGSNNGEPMGGGGKRKRLPNLLLTGSSSSSCSNYYNTSRNIPLPPMVDLKRINGLLEEYDSSLDIAALPEHHVFLQRAQKEANGWSADITRILLDDTKTSRELLCVLKDSRIHRPKGIMVDPARHVVDILIDLLHWHQQAKETIASIVGKKNKQKQQQQQQQQHEQEQNKQQTGEQQQQQQQERGQVEGDGQTDGAVEDGKGGKEGEGESLEGESSGGVIDMDVDTDMDTGNSDIMNGEGNPMNEDNSSSKEDEDSSLSLWTKNCVIPLLSEGSELIELFSRKRKSSSGLNHRNPDNNNGSCCGGQFTIPSTTEFLELLSSQQSNNSSTSSSSSTTTVSRKVTGRVLSRTKIESNALASAVLNRLLDGDEKEGFPLTYLLLFAWRTFVVGFIQRYKSNQKKTTTTTTRNSSNSNENPLRMTLEKAKVLLSQKPKIIVNTNCVGKEEEKRETATTTTSISAKSDPCMFSDDDDDDDDDDDVWDYYKRDEINEFMALIRQEENMELTARKTILMSKEVLTGDSCLQQDLIRNYLAKLKETSSEFKNRLNGKTGLVSNAATLEPQFDHLVKSVGWLVKTLPFPFLHMDGLLPEIDSTKKIPWDVLVSVHRLRPMTCLEGMDDYCAKVKLKIEEIFDEASAWQEEISSLTMLSKRGSKRRGTADNSTSVAATLSGGVDSTGYSADVQNTAAKVNIGKVRHLAMNPILSKVSMPREDAVSSILENAKKFELELHDLLGKDYDGMYPDRAPYPDARSLVGKDGVFLLFRLTGSPLFNSLRTSLESIAAVADDILADTPGKAAFEWIKLAFAWVESLQMAVTRESPFTGRAETDRLVIPGSVAKSIVDEGQKVFFNIPDDLKKTLSQHRIFVWNNKARERFKVEFKKGGAHHSVGGTVIRWCPFLFGSLQEDVSRLEKWEERVTETISRFQTLIKVTKDHGNDEDVTYQWYCFREEAALLWEEGIESLVVSPEKSIVDNFKTFQWSLNNYLESQSNTGTNCRVAKRRFEEPERVLQDRFLLLDSLIGRRMIDHESSDNNSVLAGSITKKQNLFLSTKSEMPKDSSFRDTCRTYLEKALQKGVQRIGIELNSDGTDDEEAINATYCTMLAWCIENEMFTKFQANGFGESQISPAYRDKARSLRCNLEDINNPIFCTRVLVGEIEASELVNMSPEQMASKKVKQDRERAEQAAKRNVLLTPHKAAAGTGEQIVSLTKLKTTTTQKNINDDGKQLKQSTKQILVKKTLAADDPPESERIQSPKTVSTMGRKTKSDNVEQVRSVVGRKSKSKELSQENFKPVERLKASLSRPLPPPSLVASLQPNIGSVQKKPSKDIEAAKMPKVASRAVGGSSSTPLAPPSLSLSSLGRNGKFLTNTAGTDLFSFTVSKRKFRAHLSLDHEDIQGLHGFVPEILNEKGRLHIDEFTRFLSDKLRGGRWTAIPIRLANISDVDFIEYKKFYKEYETLLRVAALTTRDNTKLFLVTPKFHKATARALRSESFVNHTSTYAVLLTKEKFR